MEDIHIHIHVYTYAYIYNEILFSLKIEGVSAICNNMDEPEGHYAKWSKPDTERQVWHDSTYMRNLKLSNP